MKFLHGNVVGKFKIVVVSRGEIHIQKVRPCTAQANAGARSRGILDLNSLLQVRREMVLGVQGHLTISSYLVGKRRRRLCIRCMSVPFFLWVLLVSVDNVPGGVD